MFSLSYRKLIFLILATIICGILWYTCLPAVTIHSTGFWCMLTINAALFFFACISEKDSKIDAAVFIGIIAICILMLFVGWISTWTVFHAEKYRSIADISVENSFDKDFPEVLPDGSNIPYVDLETAQKLGDRTIGKLKHSSWYDVDNEYNLICYKGQYYRLSPLNYSGFFEFNKGKNEGIPGYVLVNAETQASQFVKVEGGYFYSPSSYWSKNLRRNLRKQFSGSIFGKSYFEIDEEGNPYWITAVNDTSVGLFSGYKEDKFIITDAITGQSELYQKNDLPEWIDHAVGLQYAMDVLNNYYRLIHGVWNWSKTDVYRTTYFYRDAYFEGYNSYIDSNGDVCFYTGLTPANSAESNTGFLLINCKTGHVREYLFEEDDGGIEESTAIERAESEVQNYGYKSTFPMMVNIANQPTYLMCLKGNDGLMKQIALALVSTKSSTIVTADNLADAIEKYENALVKAKVIDKEQVNVEIANETENITGVISAKYEITVDGTTHYLYQINESDILYDTSVKYGYKQVAFKVGETVSLDYEVSDKDVKTVLKVEKIT